ncbi:MAG: DUF2934 domain-containing protein [Deltaproteobacteria bacterium]
MKSIVIDTARIRDRAYSRWQEQGCPAGTAERDWLAAEQELAAQHAREAAAPSAVSGKPRASAPAPRVATPVPSKGAAQREKPPRPTLKRAPSTRAAKLSNDVSPKTPPESRTERALAAAAAAHIKRSAVGSG